MHRSLALVVCLAITLTGCAGKRFDSLMQAWHGHTLRDLVGTWGPPTYVYSDGAGGRVIVYLPAEAPKTDNNGARQSPNQSTTVAEERLQPRGEYRSSMAAYWPIHRTFFVDNTDHIYRSQWRGEWVCCSMQETH